MALTVPTIAEPVDDEVPANVPRHKGNGRPKIRHLDDPTQMSYWVRASSFAERVDDMFRLDRRNERLVARGMAISPDLCELAGALAGLDTREDKEELTRIAGLAKTAAGGDVAANRGTALHKLAERRNRGEDLAFVPPRLWAALEAYTQLMEPFDVLAGEVFVVNDQLKAAGSFDAVLRLKSGYELVAPDFTVFGDGTPLGADLKSGSQVSHMGVLERAVQQVVYFRGGQPYEHVSDEQAAAGDNGRRGWGAWTPSQHWSLIIHVPLDSPEDAALWWVDLEKAGRIANVVAELWEARKTEGLIIPAEAPTKAARPSVDELRRLLAVRIRDVSELAELDALWTAHHQVWTDEHTDLARAKAAELSAGNQEVRTS